MQDTPPTVAGTFRALYTYKAFPGQRAALEAVLIEACHAVRNDRGIIGLTLARSTGIDGAYIVFSRWEDRLTLSECFLQHRDSGLVGRIADHCDVYSLDVFVPNDPIGSSGPVPGRVGEVIASRLSLPLPAHTEQARRLMEDRALMAMQADGCLWVRSSVHADRDDMILLMTGWESRAALDRVLDEFKLPVAWIDPKIMVRAVALDILEPVLEIMPDRLMPRDAQDHP